MVCNKVMVMLVEVIFKLFILILLKSNSGVDHKCCETFQVCLDLSIWAVPSIIEHKGFNNEIERHE